MREALLTILRNEETETPEFRRVSDMYARLLAEEAFEMFPRRRVRVKTPCGMASGSVLNPDLMVVPVLRSGLALLGAFMEVIPDIAVGIMGLKRDETTAKAYRYYAHFPKRLPKRALILDPMLATGNSALDVVGMLRKLGYRLSNIYFAGVIAAQDGYNALVEAGMSTSNITVGVGAIDPELNDEKYIVPGLGDYGDRYFGHNHPLSAKELGRFLTGKYRALIPGILKATEGIVVKAATVEGPFKKRGK